MTAVRAISRPLIPDGHRVRYCLGKWFADADASLRTLAPDWTSRPWATQRDGTVHPRAIAREWGLFDLPADANVIWFDGDPRPTWVRSSVLDDIGFAPKAAPGGSQLEITFA